MTKWWTKESNVLKLVSLLIAMILWVLVLSGRNFQISKALTLRLLTAPNMVVSNSPPYYVQFHFRGPKVILRGLEKRLDYVPVDLTNYEPGDHRITFHEEMLGKLPVGVQVTSIEPSSIRIRLEPLEERVLTIEPHFVGEPAEGFRITRVTIQPEKVVIRGASSRLSALTTVRTEPVRIDGLKATKNFESQVIYEYRSGIPREDRPPIIVHVEVEEIPQPRLFASIPVEVRPPPPPKSPPVIWPDNVEVRLEGPGSMIKDLDASQIKAWVDLTDKKKLKSNTLPVHIDLDKKISDRVNVVETNPARVRLLRAL